jgi:aryl-alcohol dehydrogenase-like predicted oxidoreductase
MKIGLGAVQFGMSYGVSNKHGQTTREQIIKILELAQKNGIKVLDTAPSYGNSEDILGEVVNNNDWKLVTKIPHFSDNCLNSSHANQLQESFNRSLFNLRKKNIYGLLLHSCDDLLKPGGELLFQKMEYLKSIGMVKKIGVSLYDGQQIDQLLDNYPIDLVQLPVNIFDQRLIKGGQLAKLKKYNVEIHARSIFLQGFLLMPPNNIPPWFDPIRGVLESFHKEAKKRNMSVLQLALSFVQSIDEVDKVIIGVNTLKQLKEVVDAALIRVNTMELSYMSIDDPEFINPVNWKT